MNRVRPVVSLPRIYYVNPLMLGGPADWRAVFDHAADLGFNAVLSAPLFKRGATNSVFDAGDLERTDPLLGLAAPIEDATAQLSEVADKRNLAFMLDLVVHPTQQPDRPPALDPRKAPTATGGSWHMLDAEAADQRRAEWRDRVRRLAATGVTGFRCLGLDLVPAEVWADLIAGSAKTDRPPTFLAFTPGTDFALRRRLSEIGFSGCFSSFGWWDLKESWFEEEYRLQQAFGLQVHFPEAPYAKRLAHGMDGRELLERRSIRALQVAASLEGGLLIPMGFEFGSSLPLDPTYGNGAGLRALREGGSFDLSGEIRSANTALARIEATGTPSAIGIDANGPITVVTKSDAADPRLAQAMDLVIVNRDLRRAITLPRPALREIASPFLPKLDKAGGKLLPGEVRLLATSKAPAIKTAAAELTAAEAAVSPRIAIEKITPSVDGGRFPVKRVVGDILTVEADIFADGHDVLAAALFFRAEDEETWRETRMVLVENDRWRASFPLDRNGRYEFSVEAWKNPFAIYRYELGKKHEARLDLRLELMEGEALVERAVVDPASSINPTAKDELAAVLEQLRTVDERRKTEILLSSYASRLMDLADRRPFRVRSATHTVDAERRHAAFASWYQIFPRSQSGDPNRHGTFDDVIARLPEIREMGFDVLYFPPIHPIGQTNRKGRNNSLIAGPQDPGSPYAIGSAEGGHDAIHPELGTFEDFRRLVQAAAKEGLEIALDLAIQASPDHPWLKQHPGWFDWRPDGTIRYAENPPKKYEDIVNVDFYAKDAVPALWIELREIVELWVEQGVSLFRVDNPHTKPLPFWEWLIRDVRARHPGVVFLSEAFTRPKVMYRLAKVGFSQSYTYFTWRNSKWELEQYMRELTEKEPREFFRPHFFVNTHDINPDFLQNAPRPAYLIRAALAATLSGLWGVYNGFELCEGRPDAKRKEYADSEKYEIRAWDYDRPGNIKAEIAMLNRIRRHNPALQSHLGLTLLNATNGNVLFFEKASAGRHNIVLVAISLDPSAVQESDIEIPLWQFGKDDGGRLDLEDLIGGNSFSFNGKWQRLRLDPAQLPFAIWRVRAGEV
ncbi:alpha-1,4-glucan--maltose-1-phosphate maltosyltransferase [Rhizobium sp. RU36D]|uniref:alpha-1,4-glucan--maltose-1-phosphate maltosyltransferase n=1 Tax=Rhizobium sp. RU36D TaxID=1907415 RepID=UPI0009D8C95B|nr:alpha-1,4-glucan--maltose-1-phosphate maltosyltransferase [Rhizobium sp. RU36D]SMC87481.1 alpha-1,4-glucan:maltose-1-phosphate maltosyltransferase [Rhizobium sp. RU36D]